MHEKDYIQSLDHDDIAHKDHDIADNESLLFANISVSANHHQYILNYKKHVSSFYPTYSSIASINACISDCVFLNLLTKRETSRPSL